MGIEEEAVRVTRREETSRDRVVALAGNPNVGKARFLTSLLVSGSILAIGRGRLWNCSGKAPTGWEEHKSCGSSWDILSFGKFRRGRDCPNLYVMEEQMRL